jgi:hypothetical protein
MTFRIKQRKKIFIVNIGEGYILKMRLLPWWRTTTGRVWLASLAVSKSKRQINDWMNRKQSYRVRRLDMSLTGKIGNRVQAIAIRQVRKWVDELPYQHAITLICESALPEKQFRVWEKWFKRHENFNWEISKTHKSFYFYKSKCSVEYINEYLDA